MDGMTPGLRTHKSASLRVSVAQGFPVQMWEATREIQALQADDRGHGHATALMWTTCAEADRAWLMLLVMPEPGDTLERLKRFYAKFGFEEIQADPCLMARDPQPPKIARMH